LARTTLIAMMQRLGIRREIIGKPAGQPDQPFLSTPNGPHVSHETPRETAFRAISA
jgi:hypothetical protein